MHAPGKCIARGNLVREAIVNLDNELNDTSLLNATQQGSTAYLAYLILEVDACAELLYSTIGKPRHIRIGTRRSFRNGNFCSALEIAAYSGSEIIFNDRQVADSETLEASMEALLYALTTRFNARYGFSNPTSEEFKRKMQEAKTDPDKKGSSEARCRRHGLQLNLEHICDQPTTKKSRSQAAPRTAVGTATQVCTQQPRSCVPPVYTPYEQRSDSTRSLPRHSFPRPLTSHRPSTINTSRLSRLSLSSSTMRPLSRLSFSSSRSTTRRPTIGDPSDFRKVQSGRISPMRRAPAFRPLQLSIYLPGNELAELPTCWEDFVKEVSEEIEGLERPAPALVKSKSDPMLLRRTSSSFSIPRKPVASRSSSITFDASHFSMESNLTMNTLSALNDFPKPPRSRSTDLMRPAFPEHRSSIATTRSTQDFLDALDSRLPQPPPAALRTNSEPSCAIYRRASEQSLRLRTHLEERQSLERRLPDLMEEVSPLSPRKKTSLSPISDHDSTFEAEIAYEKPLPAHNWFKPTVINVITAGHQARPASGSSFSLNPSTLNLDPFHPDSAVRANGRAGTPNSLSKRFSQWLLKALPAPPPIELDMSSEQRPSTSMSRWSSSAPTAHTKQSSTSTYWTYGAKPSFDIEKTIMPMSPGVGVAF